MNNCTKDHYNQDRIVKLYKERYQGIKGGFFYNRETKPVIRALGSILDESNILDLGMGGGRLISTLNKQNINYIGLDYSKNLVEFAHSQYPDENCLVIGDAMRIPFKDETFDAVVSIGLFESLDRVSELVAEVMRVLKKGGVFVFTAYNQSSLFQSTIKSSSYELVLFEPETLSKILKTNNYKDISIKSTFHIPNRYLWKYVNILYKLKLPILAYIYLKSFSLLQALLAKFDKTGKHGVELIIRARKP